MRFASHRDVARAIERGVRRAGIPVGYSAGFSPHPRISYPGGAPTGSASEAEYLELAVTRRCDPGDVGRRLDASLPDGIDVIEVVEADGTSVAPQLEASAWEVTVPGVTPQAAASAVHAFLAAPSVHVQRLTSKGTRTLDARAAVVSLTSEPGPAADHARPRGPAPDAATPRRAGTDPAAGCAILRMVVRQVTPAVRPDDILTALRQLSALEPGSPPRATRLWQGPMSALTAAQTGAHTGMIAALLAAGPDRPERPPPGNVPSAEVDTQPATAVSAAHMNLRPEPDGSAPYARLHHGSPASPGPASRQADELTERTTDKAMRKEAESAEPAPAIQARANEQLPRGTHGQLAGQRARKPYGRDCPDARDGATQQQTVRIQ